MTAYLKKSYQPVGLLARRGFTLIELLIVMAIIGVLAVVVLVAINPAEQLKRARDTGRISGVQQIGRAAAAYYTANSELPGVAGTWNSELVNSKELTVIPAGVAYTTGGACAGAVNNTWCYADNGTDHFVVYATLESDQRINQCGVGSTPYTVFSSYDSKGGIVCSVPSAGVSLIYI